MKGANMLSEYMQRKKFKLFFQEGIEIRTRLCYSDRNSMGKSAKGLPSIEYISYNRPKSKIDNYKQPTVFNLCTGQKNERQRNPAFIGRKNRVSFPKGRFFVEQTVRSQGQNDRAIP